MQPLVIVVMGDMLNNFGDNNYFFSLTPPEIASYLKQYNVDLASQFHSTVMKFVYFGIGMLVGNYFSQALWVYTSEVLCRVCGPVYQSK